LAIRMGRNDSRYNIWWYKYCPFIHITLIHHLLKLKHCGMWHHQAFSNVLCPLHSYITFIYLICTRAVVVVIVWYLYFTTIYAISAYHH
jgi:hypothetical protein